MLTPFNPVYFGDNYRYVAICKDDLWFVADAEVCDKNNNDRATVICYGYLQYLGSIVSLVGQFSVNSLHYEFAKNPLWITELSTEELLKLYDLYDIKTNNLFDLEYLTELELLQPKQ